MKFLRLLKEEVKPERGLLKGFLKDRLISMAMVVVIGFLLLVSLMAVIPSGSSGAGMNPGGFRAISDQEGRSLTQGLLFASAIAGKRLGSYR